MASDIRMIVASHKAYEMPQDRMYLPVQVGAAGKTDIEGFVRDDSGDQISRKNPTYCELTGLYWAWKNLDADAVGLAHYRRHFSKKSRSYRKKHGVFASVLSFDEAKTLLSQYDMVVPKKRKYYIETLYSHYAHTFEASHLDVTREIIAEKYPAYVEDVDAVYRQRYGYMFNMFLLKRDDLNEYCSWLFDVLEELERRIPTEGMSTFEARFYGRVSEILFNVWLRRRMAEGATVEEVPVVSTEPVNWFKKGFAFLAAKFGGVKYKESF